MKQLLIAILILEMATSFDANAQELQKKETTSKNLEEQKAIFIKDCKAQLSESNYPTIMATFCECGAEKLIANLTKSEVDIVFSETGITDPELIAKLKKIIKPCIDEKDASMLVEMIKEESK